MKCIIPAREARTEILVANSRFIVTLAPVFSVEEARAFIARIRSEFSAASHNVPAFIIGRGASLITHCSDDGEPSGTAGRPALAVLAGSGLGDVAVVVTRYFCGTKLGTGGLVRAYGDAVRSVLEVTTRAERITAHTVMIVLAYPTFERTRLLVSTYRGEINLLPQNQTGDLFAFLYNHNIGRSENLKPKIFRGGCNEVPPFRTHRLGGQ